MAYQELKQILGPEHVSRIEDAVLLAMAAAKRGPPEADVALQKILVAMLGAVILNQTESPSRISEIADECTHALNSALNIPTYHQDRRVN
ncbi:MAG: hypothetical protein ABL901_13340 [Hyphomicrobiaceae bacterium]